MNSCSKNGCQDLQISEDRLRLNRGRRNKDMRFTVTKLARQGKVLDSGVRPVLSMCHSLRHAVSKACQYW